MTRVTITALILTGAALISGVWLPLGWYLAVLMSVTLAWYVLEAAQRHSRQSRDRRRAERYLWSRHHQTHRYSRNPLGSRGVLRRSSVPTPGPARRR